MRLGSLFAGIGGFDLAARWMGWSTAWYSEIDPYACAVMRKHFPTAVNHGNITRFRGFTAEPVDIITGGFPCQDISFNGRGAGIDGARSGLWQHFARIIDETLPRWVVIENVAALRARGLERVVSDLTEIGYMGSAHIIPARAVGADHERERIWIIANPEVERVERLWPEGQSFAPALDRPLLPVRDRDGQWQVEPDVCRAIHGVSRRVDRLRCLGNAIVPQVAYAIFREIERVEQRCAY
jgi:DNA (cytosine-5)-methyltransferase 1